ncbi:MAG: hypothetical protein BAA03_10375 [Caldibacillus debilis]|nr:MAG: hypothetical protein BAA03_10375 [Caldibacillus debilis]
MRARGPWKDQVLLWVKSRTRPEEQSLPEKERFCARFFLRKFFNFIRARHAGRTGRRPRIPPHGKMPPSAGAGKPQDG